LAGYVVCKYQFCTNKQIPISEKETLTVDVKVSDAGIKANLYYHPECYPKHLEHQEFIKKDLQQKDELNETVKKIYNLNFDMPKRWWGYIGDLREGTNRHEKFWKKKYKQGVPYNVIKEAFLLSVQDIQWARMSKNFKTIDKELQYGLMIMQGKVNDAYRKMKTREQQTKINEALEQTQIKEMSENREVSFKKTEKDKDYSYLLGND
jgi:hypothetical protein